MDADETLNSDYQLSRGEFIFLIDRSGSMAGKRIENAKIALKSFLDKVPKNAYFNVISYGSSFKYMYQESQTVNQVENAKNKIDTFDSDMGGTEILKPIQDIIGKAALTNYPRYVFLITDGDVWNTDQIIATVYEAKYKMRFFTIGIGNGISPVLIQGVAKAGLGDYEFVKDNENIELKT